MITQDYLDLITSAWAQKPKFTAMISFGVAPMVQVQALMTGMMTTLFDVDVAVGDQLDIIGQWAGISRRVSVPVSGVYFSWDGIDPFVGWEYGIWQPGLFPANITVLPDDIYRTFVKAKIATNQWDGTTTGMYLVWDSVFTAITILIQDNQDMSYDLAFVGGIIDSLTLSLIIGGFLPLKPEGVRVNTYYIPIDSNTLFGWDLENTYIQGWDEGSWAREFS